MNSQPVLDSPNSISCKRAAIIGGGPTGLIAAQYLAANGVQVDLYDAMPSVGRKFLLAGKGGMNLTHAEASELFISRYGSRQILMAPLIEQFGPDQLRNWCRELGIETFVGSSQRVFPTDMKAAPLLRAWLHRLRQDGVQFHMRHRWFGPITSLPSGKRAGKVGGTTVAHDNAQSERRLQLQVDTPTGPTEVEADAVILALGGGSWPRLGSDGAWVDWLAARGVKVLPLISANCGFDLSWSQHFRDRWAGQPVKSVAVEIDLPDHSVVRRRGEFLVTDSGIEGSLVYALAAPMRDQIVERGTARIRLDLLPDLSLDQVLNHLNRGRGARSWSSHLQSKFGLSGTKTALLREVLDASQWHDIERLATTLKNLPLTLARPRPLAEAISSAGGVAFESLDSALMLQSIPGVFCAGEMLDWEAPTGGYLLTGCLATGHAAARGVLKWLQRDTSTDRAISPGG